MTGPAAQSRTLSGTGDRPADHVAAAVAVFGRRVAEKLGRGGDNEDQLRGPTEELFRSLGRGVGLDVIPYGEVRVPEFAVRPDYALDIDHDRIGYIELKAPGTGVPPKWVKDYKRNREQYERLCELPNLLYSDGVNWRLIQAGQTCGDIVRLDGAIEDGTLRPPSDGSFHELVSGFLTWRPKQPTTLRKLIRMISGPCRILRATVAELIELESTSPPGRRPFTRLAENWRTLLFPNLADRDFPDAYAQTVTFALLLAREAGIEFGGQSLHDIAAQLRKQQPLMGRALHVLAHEEAVKQLRILDTIRLVVGAVDWQKLPERDRQKYWDLYEPFLSEYDKNLRKRSGTYYTPEPVAGFMVDFVDQILRKRLGRRRGFAADDVIALDPAMGTGTFLVEVIRSAARTITDEHNKQFARDHLRELYRSRLVGFERSAAPYVVAELRLHQTLKDIYGVEPPEQSMRFLANTLDDPQSAGELGLEYTEILESRDRANEVKRKIPIVAIVGNPPYIDKAHRRDPAPWIEERRPADKPVDLTERPALDDFRLPGNGRLEYALSNTGTYFWRWCTWKVFDAHPEQRAGVIALVTTSAYIKGAAFAGMRRYLRTTCDEGWIIDLSPEGQRSVAATRIFRGVAQPICIGIFVRTENCSNSTTPAMVRYRAVHGSREDKFATLTNGLALEGNGWRDCPSGWTEDFMPDDPEWSAHPRINELMPWEHPGIKPGRTWVYAPRPDVLEQRWRRFAASGDQAAYLKVSDNRDTNTAVGSLPPLRETLDTPPIEECAFRSFDRQYLFADARLIDRLREPLWDVRSFNQVYASLQHDQPTNSGPGIIFTHLVPDQHHFGGRGGKILPLYRNVHIPAENIAPGLREHLSSTLKIEVSSADVLAYIAAVVAHPNYTQRFWLPLRRPGVRLPLTADPRLWTTACDIGAEVIWLHTFGERYSDPEGDRPSGPPRLQRGRRPQVIVRIPGDPDKMPEGIRYDSASLQIHIGDGVLGPVEPAAWAYEVGGRPIVRQWFSYRQRTRRHQRWSSPLDDTRLGRWTAPLTDDLLDLIHVLTRLVDNEPRQASLLEEICNGPLLTVSNLKDAGVLPAPAAAKKPPRIRRQDELPFG